MATIEKRTGTHGRISYQVKVRLRGSKQVTSTFTRLFDAKRWAQQTETAIREGRHFGTTEAKRRTLGEMIDRYMESVLPGKPKSAKRQGQQLAWWRQELGHLPLADLTPPVLVEARDALAKGITPRGGQRSSATVNRYLAALSHVFSVAVREFGWLEDNPLRRVSKPKEPRGRTRYLSDDERARLLAACKESESPDLYHAVVLALSTGARRMEVLGLRWSQVDFSRRAITLTTTKNNEIRTLPLVGLALELMIERSKVQHISGLVFPSRLRDRPISLRKPFQSALRRADIKDFRWHDMRHTAAACLAMNGASLLEIAKILGHRTLSMVQRYAHLSDDHTTAVVSAMNDKIFKR